MLKNAANGIHKDLFVDAFAIRPLPPLADDHLLVRLAPGRTGHYLRWLPHTALGLLTAFLTLTALRYSGPVGALLTATPLLLTLFRPLGAWWLSAGAVVLAFGLGVNTAGALIVHVLVMALVAMRTRPRIAAEMWLLTMVLLVFLDAFLLQPAGAPGVSGLFELMLFSGVLLFAVLAVRGIRESRQQVAAQQAVTRVERTRRTVLEERTTIARELHDVVAHHMSVVAIQAEAAPYRVEQTPPELAAAFATIRENAVAALTELRRVLGVIRSEDPEGAGPEAPQPTLATLDGLLANVRQAGLSVEHLTTGAIRPLPPGVELSAYRIVQEALSNVLRHAPGAAARVEISHVLGGLGLRVVNGPPDRLAKPSPGAGQGVLGMRERVAMLGGELTAGPLDDGGYEVAAFLPVAVGEAAA
ncbi:sensor histidine kinase [Streptomyces sp. NPDC052396]|uniref:sensor histidine kinase n=1 Tax=Streptomyces sp. NPDC052396 TaxID=3365689 RepID=UPI0037CDB046